MQKGDRQKAIVELVSASNISRQEELTELLEKRGFHTTQSSISRDLIDLGMIKVNGYYSLPRRAADSLSNLLLSLDTAGPYMIVAKTPSGLASAAAVRIDAAGIVEIVGTIAGDDTIFIAVKDEKEQRSAVKKIWEVFDL